MINQQLFTSIIYRRGLDYYQSGKVIHFRGKQNEYRAVVKGTQNYYVTINFPSQSHNNGMQLSLCRGRAPLQT